MMTVDTCEDKGSPNSKERLTIEEPYVGMTSSSKSENINSFFDEFVNANTQINEFIIQYDKDLQSRRQTEEHEDYLTLNSNAPLFTSLSIEKMTAQTYTKSVFKFFQQEFKASLECWYEIIMVYPNSTLYKVGLSNEDISKWCCVLYDETENINVKCECAKFELHGYLCKHILHIMVFIKHLKFIPNSYILKRWTISARNTSSCTSDDINSDEVTLMMKWRLKGLAKKLLNQTSLSVPIYEEVYDTLNDLSLKYEKFFNNEESDKDNAQTSSALVISQIPEIIIRDPQIVYKYSVYKYCFKNHGAILLEHDYT